MSENERELLTMIRTSDDPKEALLIAIEIICDYINKNVEHTDPLTLTNIRAKITA